MKNISSPRWGEGKTCDDVCLRALRQKNLPPCHLSPVLKIARLGLPLELVRDVLDDLRTFGRWDVSHGMSEGLTACASQHHGQRMERDTGLLPAVHQSRNLTTQGDDLWRIIIMGRQFRSSRHRLSSGVM